MNYKHGRTPIRLYNIWKSMRQRCTNANASNYKKYGGNGISICDEWNDYSVFRNWALLNGYKNDLTIDRIDFRGNYDPSNCRWVTYEDQNNNKSSNRMLTYNGESHTMAQWGRLVGISSSTIHARLKRGWSVERALSTPIKKVVTNGQG